jgi:ABC-type lipoprotein release transport system permease subunit
MLTLLQVKAMDVLTYVGVFVLLLVVGIVASLIPAQRAASVEPIEALRDE